VAQGSRTTFAKRQKEQARKEKQRAKSEKRQQKKLDGPGDGPPIEGMDIEGFDGPLDGPILPDWAIDDVPAPEPVKADKQKHDTAARPAGTVEPTS
jgi:hypothetical protein